MSAPEQFGEYLVYEQLGIGGMAQVHRAVRAGDGFHRPVALKRMLEHVASDDELVKAFVREARLASFLRHANVAQTYDLGRVGDVYYIVMELITGRNLREVLQHCGRTTGPMPVPIALNILNQICDALDYAHNLCDDSGQPLGIIHRDVSPSNIIVADSGTVKLIDFGIAKASAAGMQTMSGTLKGKFGYMAPEYIGGSLDARADLFALGVIAHELLTNRPLFRGSDDLETLKRVRDMAILPPSRLNPKVPTEIDDLVMTALARDPDRRWQHATALRAALTTMTMRLGMAVSNTQVVQWLDWAFDQRTPRPSATVRTQPGAAPVIDASTTSPDNPRAHPEDSEPSISIEGATSVLGPAFVPSGPVAAPAGATPVGTPASMTAQRSIPPAAASVAPTKVDEPAYQEAVARYERHPQVSGVSVDQLAAHVAAKPTMIGGMAAPAVTARTGSAAAIPLPVAQIGSSAGIALPRTQTPTGPQSAQRGVVSAQLPAQPSGQIPIPVGPPAQILPAQPSGGFAPQPAAPVAMAPAMPASAEGNHTMTIVLVLIAAAAAAAAVYFLLPLIT